VAKTLSSLIERAGGTIRTNTMVKRLARRNGSWTLETSTGAVQAAFLVTCGGLQEDRLVARASRRRDLQILPFRGDYYTLAPPRRGLVRTMIYPVPNPLFPFLGVHFTRALDGTVHVGPNAVLAFKREGYGKADVNLRDTLAMLSFPGFWRMAWKYWAVGLEELCRSWNRRAFVQAAQRLVPDLQSDDLVPAGSGVRAQAVDRRGTLVSDFDFLEEPRALHVRNVPSPAATASLRIAQLIADRVPASY
jgi:L-2-hydroxyglutarate oxidase LhgO